MAITYGVLNSIADDGDSLSNPGVVIVLTEAFIYNFTSSTQEQALLLLDGAYKVTVNGVVGSGVFTDADGDTVPEGDGITFDASTGKSKLTVGASGHVFGFNSGVVAYHPTDIINGGFIQGADTGIYAFGDGNYKIINKGEIDSLNFAAIDIFGTGQHTIVNSGYVYSQNYNSIDATLGDSVEIVLNSGTLGGDVDLGDGADRFTNFIKTGGKIKDGFVDGAIYLGAGADTFVGGKFAETVYDEGGKDSYELGGGDDTFGAGVFFDAGDATDTVDGGKGNDWYDASGATDDLNINLDSKVQFDFVFGANLAARTATDDGFGDFGTDKIKNFENAIGGSGQDSIFGTAAANDLEGNDNDDALYGLAGNDSLYGGSGLDDLVGGKGKDFLYGGGADGDTDYFDYISLTDSTPGVAGRDIIFDFQDDEDFIDFSAINDHIGGSMSFIGQDVKFDGATAGEIRVLTIGSGWLIQLDAGTDKKVDLAIEVRDIGHNIVWDDTDFLLVLI